MIGGIRRIATISLAMLALVACSDSPPADSDGTTADAPTPGAVATTPDIYDAVHPAGSGDYVGAVDDVTAHTCELESDGWRVTASLLNPTDDPVDYRVYISLLNGTNATRALVEREVLAVASGAEGQFDTLIPMPEAGLRCVLRVERRPPGT